jgi:hypothetical protein
MAILCVASRCLFYCVAHQAPQRTPRVRDRDDGRAQPTARRAKREGNPLKKFVEVTKLVQLLLRARARGRAKGTIIALGVMAWI